jgi:hypothetical protein
MDQAASFTVKDLVNLLAIFLGPVTAVLVTRFVDNRRAQHDRRMGIFRTLMGTRRIKLHAERVGALNLIKIEFYRYKDVLDRLNAYINDMNNGSADLKKWAEVSDELFTKLVQAIGMRLGYKIEQLDIFKGGYVPRGWEMIENEQQMFRQLIIELLQGKRSVPITNMYHFGTGGVFPPPPDAS